MTGKYLIDPPMGAEFGFPKPFDGDPDVDDLDAWLLANGYPQKFIDLFHPDGVPCRVLDTE